jgi:hypothetical protein
MITSKILPARMLEIKFGRASKKGFVHNVELQPFDSLPNIDLAENEIWVAKLLSKNGQSYFFTGQRIVWEIGQYTRHVEFEKVSRVHWISDSSLERVRLKRSHYDYLVLEMVDGEKARLNELDQAVFPLLNFFNWLLVQNRSDN